MPNGACLDCTSHFTTNSCLQPMAGLLQCWGDWQKCTARLVKQCCTESYRICLQWLVPAAILTVCASQYQTTPACRDAFLLLAWQGPTTDSPSCHLFAVVVVHLFAVSGDSFLLLPWTLRQPKPANFMWGVSLQWLFPPAVLSSCASQYDTVPACGHSFLLVLQTLLTARIRQHLLAVVLT